MEAGTYNKLKPLDEPKAIFDLSGRHGIILGGAGQMGQQFGRVLGKAGASVSLADVDGEVCSCIADEVSAQTGAKITGYGCDVNREEQIEDLFRASYKQNDRLDFLIYAVMAKPKGYYAPFDRYERTTWQNVIDGNLTGAFSACRHASSYMSKAGAGSVVIVSSVYGIVGPDQRIYNDCSAAENIYGGEDALNCPAAYSASKAGLIGLTKYLATLWGASGVRVNALIPGGVYDGQEDAFHNAYINRTPLERMAVWSDFNGAILFLTSDASRYMTGACMVIDGGWTVW